MIGEVVNHLRHLVSFDTQNPPRLISGNHPAISYCTEVLEGAGCQVAVHDFGEGCVNLIATRGKATTLVNCHLDTVPADSSWATDPFSLELGEGVAVGLGACDIKGAAACLLAAAEHSDGPLAILLTTDEEAGKSHCVRSFLASLEPPHPPTPSPQSREGESSVHQVIVCEPTECKAVLEHRGLNTFELTFSGSAGHSSDPNATKVNAVHAACYWVSSALSLCSHAPFDNLRFNVGVVEGGTKANVAASAARVVFGMRPPAGCDVRSTVAALQGLASEPPPLWNERFAAPALNQTESARDFAEGCGLVIGDPVDFWTEGALFAVAGYPTLVYGPGKISQAHTAGESVALEQLERATGFFLRLFTLESREGGAP